MSNLNRNPDSDLNDSWVDLSAENCRFRVPTPPMTVGCITSNIERLLLEAQRESNQSSLRGSSKSSRHASPIHPDSPIHINKDHGEQLAVAADWIWDWSSRPDQHPPKQWKFKHPPSKTLSVRNTKVAKSGFFSAEILSIFFITNIISVFIGAGIGMYIVKRFNLVTVVTQK